METGKASVSLGFEYDPKKLDAFLQDLEKMKASMVGTEESVEKMQKGFSKFGAGLKGIVGLLAGALSAVSGKMIINRARVLENINEQTTYFFGSFSAKNKKLSKEIQDTYNIAGSEIKQITSKYGEELISLGTPKDKAHTMALEAIKDAKDLSRKSGKPFEDVLAAIQDFNLTGNTELIKMLKLNVPQMKAIMETLSEVSMAGLTEQGRVDRRSKISSRLVKKEAGGTYKKDQSLTKGLEELDSSFTDLKDNIVGELTPALIQFVNFLNGAVEAFSGSWLYNFLSNKEGEDGKTSIEKVQDFGGKLGSWVWDTQQKAKEGIEKAKEAADTTVTAVKKLVGGKKGEWDNGQSKTPGTNMDVFNKIFNIPSVNKDQPQSDKSSNTTINNNVTVNATGDGTDIGKKVVAALDKRFKQFQLPIGQA